MSNDLIDETQEAMTMLKSYDGPKTVIEFEPSTDKVVRDRDGQYHNRKTEPFIKLGIGFRDELKTCKGAALAVFLSICLHVNEKGRAWPSIKTICEETGYETEAVSRALRALKERGLLRVTPRRGTSSIYEPILAAYGRGVVRGMVAGINRGTRKTENPSPGKSGVVPPLKTENKEEPLKKNQEEEPIGADARALAPSGESEGKRARRDALDIQASFDALKAQGRAEGRDRTAAAHPMAGRWPHLVEHCRAFEEASGLSAADLTRSQLAKWARDLEGHTQAGLVADDERRLYGMARAERWKVYSPGSMDSLIATMRKGAAVHSVEQPARPLY